jgi:hypothetical protein
MQFLSLQSMHHKEFCLLCFAQTFSMSSLDDKISSRYEKFTLTFGLFISALHLQNNSCPKCNALINNPNVSVNFSYLEDILSSKEDIENVCAKHNKQNSLWCIDCKERNCIFCLKKNETHSGHNFTVIKDKVIYDKILNEATNKNNQFQDILNNYNLESKQNSAKEMNTSILETIKNDKINFNEIVDNIIKQIENTKKK